LPSDDADDFGIEISLAPGDPAVVVIINLYSAQIDPLARPPECVGACRSSSCCHGSRVGAFSFKTVGLEGHCADDYEADDTCRLHDPFVHPTCDGFWITEEWCGVPGKPYNGGSDDLP
jgi:hypothetical protein